MQKTVQKLTNFGKISIFLIPMFLVPTARGRCIHLSIAKGAGNLGLSATQSVRVWSITRAL